MKTNSRTVKITISQEAIVIDQMIAQVPQINLNNPEDEVKG
jgi:hypothetical protein